MRFEARSAISTAFVPLAGLILLVACGGGGASSGGASTPTPTPAATPTPSPSAPHATQPADAVTGYLQAAKSQDCPTAFAYLTDPLKSRFGSAATVCQSLAAAPITDFKVGAVSNVDANTATVAVTLTLGGGSAGTYNDAVTVVQQGGAWYVSNIART